MRRSEERIRYALGLVGQRVTRLLDHESNAGWESPDSVGGPEGSPLENIGPIPAEMLKDPNAVESIPWSIRSAERSLKRERLIWMSALIVSWLVSTVAVLRHLSLM